jgi:hypothetical protein
MCPPSRTFTLARFTELEPSIQFKCHATQIPSFFIFKIDWKNTETNAAETLVLNVFVSIGA